MSERNSQEFRLQHLIGAKSPVKKLDGWNNCTEGRREGQKKGQKDAQPVGTKEGRELVPLVVGSYLNHSPSNFTCVKIVKLHILKNVEMRNEASPESVRLVIRPVICPLSIRSVVHADRHPGSSKVAVCTPSRFRTNIFLSM
jgi:hypothetical protein